MDTNIPRNTTKEDMVTTQYIKKLYPNSKQESQKAPIIESSKETIGIRNQIKNINDAMELMHILNNIKNSDNMDRSIYGMALKKAIKFKSKKLLNDVLNMGIYDDKIDDITVEYSIYLNGMIQLNQFGTILNDLKLNGYKFNDKIKPNVITFGILIRGCRNEMNNIQYAELLFGLMINQYGIKPDNVIINEMLKIYSRYKLTQKAMIFFNEYVNSNEKCLKDIIVWTNFLETFANVGECDKMNAIFNRALEYCKPDSWIITSMMKGYIVGKQPNKTVKMYQKMIKLGYKPDPTIFHLLLNAYYMIMEGNSENKDISLKYFNKIMVEVPINMENCDIKMDFKHYQIQFCAVIEHYCDKNPNKIIKFWNENSQFLGFLDETYSRINLHQMRLKMAKFIIIGIFCNKFDLKINESNALTIIVGKRIHSKNMDINKSLTETIKNFLIGFNPSIKSEYLMDYGELILNENDIHNWFNKNNDLNIVYENLVKQLKGRIDIE